MADLLEYIILLGITLTHLRLTRYFWQNGILQYKYLAISFLIIAVFISLRATIWRGNEYSWNGSILYLPCPTKIIIKYQKEKKSYLSQCVLCNRIQILLQLGTVKKWKTLR